MHTTGSWGLGVARLGHLERLFRRRLWPHARASTEALHALVADRGPHLLAASRSDPAHLLARLHSHAQGLTQAEADRIRARVGPNEVAHDPPLRWWTHLWHAYRNPFNLLLTLLSGMSWLSQDRAAALIIATMVLLSTLLRFVQDGRASRAAEGLRARVSNTATVWRRPSQAGERAAQVRELPMAQLVPGDVVQLAAGDMIPGDGRVLAAKDLFVAQQALTGEAMPVEKFATAHMSGADAALALDNIVFMGTNVVSGAATVLLLATGPHTLFGALARRVTATQERPTAFQRGVNEVSWLLIRFMLVLVPLVFVLNGLSKGDWLQALLFALSVAVGLTPEMLPMVMASTLAKGAVFLSHKKVVVKHLDAIENLGAMDVLCADKTGTLTQDRIVLARHLDAWGQDSHLVLQMAWLNSHHQTGLKNLLDVAVLEHASSHEALGLAEGYAKVDEIPFDFERRRMSVVLSPQAGRHLLICKGALDEVLAVCSQVRRGAQTEPLTPAVLASVAAWSAQLNDEGMRVVAVAVKELAARSAAYGVADEQGLSLVGCVAFLDPPKASAGAALQALAAHGVAVKVLTGDNERVTLKVCRDVGLAVRGVLLGPQLERMDDAALAQALDSHDVLARLSPAHKERVVRQLRAAGHVVGFLGDGINDAPALRAADVGMSVDTAVDIAKEAADIILLEKSLGVLDEGVTEGRRTFANMLKYLRVTASSNLGNVISVLVASVAIPFLPMLPLHLLVQNLLYDLSQTAIAFDHVDAEQLLRPQRWQSADLGRFMLVFGPLSSAFDMLTFALMWFVFGANSPAAQTLFQSGWFVVGVLTQVLAMHLMRSPRLPFVQSRAAAPLMASTLAIMAVAVFLPMGPLAPAFQLQPLPPSYFAWVAAILLTYLLLAQGLKRLYVRRFGWQSSRQQARGPFEDTS